jgi:PAS domain S-box-containing protein
MPPISTLVPGSCPLPSGNALPLPRAEMRELEDLARLAAAGCGACEAEIDFTLPGGQRRAAIHVAVGDGDGEAGPASARIAIRKIVAEADGGVIGEIGLLFAAEAAASAQAAARAAIDVLAAQLRRMAELARLKAAASGTAAADARADTELKNRMLAASEDCIKILSLEGRLEYMNPNGICLMEIDDFHAFAGAWWPGFWAAASAEGQGKAMRALGEAAAGRSSRFQAPCDTAKGRRKWWDVVVVPLFDPAGTPERLLSISRDVTDMFEARQRLRRSEERLRLALDGAGLATWDCDPVTREQDWCERHFQLLGYAHGEIPTSHEAWCERVHPDDKAAVESALGMALRMGTQFSVEYRLKKKDGNFGWFSSLGRAQYHADGSIARFAGITREVTEAREAEEELRTAQEQISRAARLSAVGAMASTLAHELNQPLTALSNYLSAGLFLLETAPGDPAAIEPFSHARDQVHRAGEIIRRVRGYAANGHLQRRHADLHAVLDAVERSLTAAGRQRLRIARAIGEDAAVLFCDSIQIQQVLTNLVRNAMEAMHASPNPRVTVSAVREGDRIVISVSDEGPGLAEAQRERLFQPFESGKSDGLGLGLAICRTIADSHGGRIYAAADASPGATFVLELPAPESDPR